MADIINSVDRSLDMYIYDLYIYRYISLCVSPTMRCGRLPSRSDVNRGSFEVKIHIHPMLETPLIPKNISQKLRTIKKSKKFYIMTNMLKTDLYFFNLLVYYHQNHLCLTNNILTQALLGLKQ